MPLRPRLSKLRLTEDRVIFGLGCVFLPEPHTWKAHLTSTPLAGAPGSSQRARLRRPQHLNT